MRGMEDGRFAPAENCTIEQCALMCLRLYENAPFSGKNGDFAPIFTYEQGLAYTDVRNTPYGASNGGVTYAESARVDGPLATFRRMECSGRHRASLFYFVDRDGGVREVDLGVCDRVSFVS